MASTYLKWVKWSVCLSLFLPLVAASCTRLILGESVAHAGFLLKLASVWLGLFVVATLLWVRIGGWYDRIESVAEDQVAFLDRLSERWVPWAIFLAAAMSLLLELVVIRWQASVFTLFAFYKNVGLLTCFAGLGLGYALARGRAIPLVLVFPLLAWQVVLLLFTRYNGEGLRSRSLLASPVVEQLNMEFTTASGPAHLFAIYFFLFAVFLLTALAFVPVGQLCGRLMMRRDNLGAYGFNLLGSLLGVIAAFAVGWLWTPPVIWFGLALLGLMPFLVYRPGALLTGGMSAIVLLAALAWPVNTLAQQVYSPYQLVERAGQGGWMKISASGIHFQVALDLSPANPAREQNSFLKAVRGYYELPYRLHGGVASAVIVGAGTGNDVAAALRNDVARVAAVEIDPVILHFGKAYHPEEPYAHPAVEVFVDDARSFFRRTGETFDAVVYGFLDSHALLSHASNLRVDSFVYTVEGIREARARLKDGGILSLTFNILSPGLGRKIYLMMTEAFDGKPPMCLRATESDYGAVTFVQREGAAAVAPPELLASLAFEDCTPIYADPSIEADPSTDDWPFLYMPRRVYPVSYLGMLGLIAVLSIALIGTFSEGRPRASDGVFFFLGAGFMLIETKGITELGLILGNTWQVIGFVIAGILAMAFLANVAVQYLQIQRTYWIFAGLFIALAVSYLVARAGGMPPTPVGKLGAILVLTGPVFFSGLVFSSLIRGRGNIAGIMAANLLGAMFGGLLEYNSMYFGFGALYILAGLIYAVALVLSGRRPAHGGDGEV